MPELGNTALKIGSTCSFTPVNCAVSPIFALSNLRSPTFRTEPRVHRTAPALAEQSDNACSASAG
ncbi:hypothetical protein C6W88_16115 [Halomonas litopenaei]|uniref:Uncharacterized protein n=1 Tax=Halomonas litopenaei TaxID=2109328 RepID=A0ABX5ITX1_9GAMM|nr:hypothetical protein [Halomonas litopenaei]PTL90020.1 hypothetical protein C6W89_15535 [Halomonas sp. SYSU XM8]PTL92523.1 hypothetical protein C6W88_16115 [Halomonas litopenaei]